MLSCSCNECGNVIDEGSESYCESCFRYLRERLKVMGSDNGSMVNQIESLEEENKDLLYKINELENKE